MIMKKIYEVPSAEVYHLCVQDNLLSKPSVSDSGFGFDDVGPVDSRRADGE